MKIWAGGDKVRVLKAVNDPKIIKNMTSIQTDAQVGKYFRDGDNYIYLSLEF